MTYKEKRLQEFREKFAAHIYGDDWEDMEAFLAETIGEIKSDFIKIADKGEYEDLRREVERYFTDDKEDKPLHGCWACGIAHKHGECGKEEK